MKNKSFFSQIMLLLIISAVCILLTVGIALLAGSSNTTFFDFGNLNFSNMLPVLILGCFISCVVIGIAVLFTARTVFFKVKNYLFDNEGEKK